MSRILITGCPGSGKSTLALKLAERTGLPLIHLDKLYWEQEWKAPVEAEWIKKLNEVVAESAWIIDGNYHGTLEQRLEVADTVIFLDLPRWICMWRVLWRIALSFGTTRSDMADNCPERFDMEFLFYVWRFRSKRLPTDLERLRRFPGRVFILRNTHQIDEFPSMFMDLSV